MNWEIIEVGDGVWARTEQRIRSTLFVLEGAVAGNTKNFVYFWSTLDNQQVVLPKNWIVG